LAKEVISFPAYRLDGERSRTTVAAQPGNFTQVPSRYNPAPGPVPNGTGET